MSKLLTWKEMSLGGMIVGSGTSDAYRTGGWRTYKPVHDDEKCVNCLRCWILCPDSAVKVEDGKWGAFNYDHCKGCGICARECPPKIQAITMVRDSGTEE